MTAVPTPVVVGYVERLVADYRAKMGYGGPIADRMRSSRITALEAELLVLQAGGPEAEARARRWAMVAPVWDERRHDKFHGASTAPQRRRPW